MLNREEGRVVMRISRQKGRLYNSDAFNDMNVFSRRRVDSTIVGVSKTVIPNGSVGSKGRQGSKAAVDLVKIPVGHN